MKNSKKASRFVEELTNIANQGPVYLMLKIVFLISVQPLFRAGISDHGQLLPDGSVDAGRQPSRVCPDDAKQLRDVARRIASVHQVLFEEKC